MIQGEKGATVHERVKQWQIETVRRERIREGEVLNATSPDTHLQLLVGSLEELDLLRVLLLLNLSLLGRALLDLVALRLQLVHLSLQVAFVLLQVSNLQQM